MNFRTFSYTKKNRFDYPVWRTFVTFMFGFNLKQPCEGGVKAWFLSFPSCPFAVLIGRKSYYTWDKIKSKD